MSKKETDSAAEEFILAMHAAVGHCIKTGAPARLTMSIPDNRMITIDVYASVGDLEKLDKAFAALGIEREPSVKPRGVREH